MRTFFIMALLISGWFLYNEASFAKVKASPCQKQTAPGKAKLHPVEASNLMMACTIDQWEILKTIAGPRQVISYLICKDRDGEQSLFHRVPDHSTSQNNRTAYDLATSTPDATGPDNTVIPTKPTMIEDGDVEPEIAPQPPKRRNR